MASAPPNPTLTTNYEYACHLITMLQLLRHKPRPVRKSSSNLGGAASMSSQQRLATTSTTLNQTSGGFNNNSSANIKSSHFSLANSSSKFQFGNVQIALDPPNTEMLPFPEPSERPKALCLLLAIDEPVSNNNGGGGRGGGGNVNNATSFCSADFTSIAAAVGGGSRQHHSMMHQTFSSSAHRNASFASSSNVVVGMHLHETASSAAAPPPPPPPPTRVVESWTVEYYSHTTMVTSGRSASTVPAVATRAQIAGLCRQMCAHSTAHPLPSNLFRVGKLKPIGEPNRSEKPSAMGGRITKGDDDSDEFAPFAATSSAAFIRGGGNKSNANTMGAPSSSFGNNPLPSSHRGVEATDDGDCCDYEEQSWLLMTADRVPCLAVRWRMNKTAIQLALNPPPPTPPLPSSPPPHVFATTAPPSGVGGTAPLSLQTPSPTNSCQQQQQQHQPGGSGGGGGTHATGTNASFGGGGASALAASYSKNNSFRVGSSSFHSPPLAPSSSSVASRTVSGNQQPLQQAAQRSSNDMRGNSGGGGGMGMPTSPPQMPSNQNNPSGMDANQRRAAQLLKLIEGCEKLKSNSHPPTHYLLTTVHQQQEQLCGSGGGASSPASLSSTTMTIPATAAFPMRVRCRRKPRHHIAHIHQHQEHVEDESQQHKARHAATDGTTEMRDKDEDDGGEESDTHISSSTCSDRRSSGVSSADGDGEEDEEEEDSDEYQMYRNPHGNVLRDAVTEFNEVRSKVKKLSHRVDRALAEERRRRRRLEGDE